MNAKAKSFSLLDKQILRRTLVDAFVKLAIPVRGDRKERHAGSIIHLASRGETQNLTLHWPVHPLR
jgi:hypothetical protein